MRTPELNKVLFVGLVEKVEGLVFDEQSRRWVKPDSEEPDSRELSRAEALSETEVKSALAALDALPSSSDDFFEGKDQVDARKVFGTQDGMKGVGGMSPDLPQKQEKVPMDALRYTQPTVTRDGVRGYVEGTGEDPKLPYVAYYPQIQVSIILLGDTIV